MKTKLLVILMFTIGLSACGPATPTANQIERRKQEELSKQGVETVGFPAIINFAEKRMMKDIIEKRDQMQPTYTYIIDMNGKPHKICDSLGYGLPYATQYTNPQARQTTALSDGSRSSDVIAQADPNGLYSPASADGTWVMCLNPKTKKAEPQYIEPRIITTTYPLDQ
jgi:hypothetical protein